MIRRLAWAAVLAANLPMTVLFGVNCTDERGQIGMFAGIGLVWLLGHECCRRYPRTAWTVIPGGWVVAVSQLFPALQILAGSASLWAVALGTPAQGDFRPRVRGPLAAFTATILTGGILLTVAAVFGVCIRALFNPVEAGYAGKPEVARDELA